MAALLERETDLATLADAVERLRAERTGGLVLVEGPPGIGKTALLEAALAGAGGLAVLRARGAELEAGLTFGAVRELFGATLRGLDAGERAALFEGPGRLAARVLGYAEDGLSTNDIDDPLYGLYWLAAGFAERTPCILAIDDLHWLDEESARFVSYLASRLEETPMLLIATARPGDAAAALAGHATVLRPQPLSVAAVGELVGARDPGAAHHASGGNPLLVTEITRAPAETPVEAIGPASLGRGVIERVARISDEALALAQAVALFAGGATLEEAAAVAELSAEVAADAAQRLAEAHVLVGGERLEFLHPLMRTAVYEQLDAFARRPGHAAAARALRDRGASVEAVAAHLLVGAPQGEAENIRVLRAAADGALAAAAPRGAIRYLERALAEPVPDGAARVETLHLLGRLQAYIGRPEAIETLRSAVAAAADPRAEADAAADLAAVLSVHHRARESVELLLNYAGRRELDPERALTVDGLLAGLALDAGRRELFEAATARIPNDLPGTTPAQRLALRFKARERAGQGARIEDVIAIARRAIAADGSCMFAELGALHGDVSVELLEFQQLEDVERIAMARIEDARARGQETAYLSALRMRGIAAAMRGHLSHAEELMREVLEHPASSPEVRASTRSMLAELLGHRGRFDEAYATLDGIGEERGWPAIRGMRRATIDKLRGDHSSYEAFKAMIDESVADGWVTVGANAWVWCHYAEGLARNGRADEAMTILEGKLAEAEAVGDEHAIGMVELTMGRAGPAADAEAHFQRAVVSLARSPNELMLGWARLELGATLRRAGRRVECREHLSLALDYAERHGAAVLAARAREELKMTGARPRRDFVLGADALTPAEARIARLAADGRSNREIAGELFLTVGTVKTTLIKVYRKLDVSSRADLATALGRKDLPPR